MPDPNHQPLGDLVDRIVASYRSDERTQHIDSAFLPNRAATIEVLELLRRLLFPGFFEPTRLAGERIAEHVADLLTVVRDRLYEQVRQALRYEENRTAGNGHGDRCDHCDDAAARLTMQFLEQVPELRRLLALDVQAAFDGDPAAVSTDEAIFCYPGVDAVFAYRIAHALHALQVPLLPRILSEYAHNETGIDIHPGATIGESFFIDHGTGVVIGETTVIGNRVKIYQGVTLGALSTRGGQAWRGMKRHPTLEDDTTIYGGAIILGGSVVIGEGSTVGGSVFLTASVPPHHMVTMKERELEMKPLRKGKKA